MLQTVFCETIVLYFDIAVVLWSGCFGAWLRHLTRGQIDVRIWTDCKLYYFMFYFGRHYSSMLLVLMSLEKCFAVYFPLKSKTVCTVKTAKWSTGVTGVILGGFNLQWFAVVKTQFNVQSGLKTCVMPGNYNFTYSTIDSILYAFGPFAVMFITNFGIIIKFMTAKCKKSNSTESTNQALSKAATRGTAMVVTVSATFLLLTAPIGVQQAMFRYTSLVNSPFYRTFMNITTYLNHSINGVLYCIVGSRFRKELMDLFSRNQQKRNTSLNSTSVEILSN